MAYQIEINDKQAYEWLKKLINNTLESPSSRPFQTAYEELLHWKEAFDKCDEEREKLAEIRRQNSKKAVAKKPPVKRRTVKKEISEFDCAEHSTYGGVRVPRTNCKKCWSIYKKLHPMEYEQSLRKFKLKEKQKKQ